MTAKPTTRRERLNALRRLNVLATAVDKLREHWRNGDTAALPLVNEIEAVYHREGKKLARLYDDDASSGP